MKFNLGAVITFHLSSNGIQSTTKTDIIAVVSDGKRINVKGDGRDYYRKIFNGKYLYIAKESNPITYSIQTPGSKLQLSNEENYAVPVKPEEDDWTSQEIFEMVNTYVLRKLLQESKEANEKLLQFIGKKGITVFDRSATNSHLLKQINPIKRFIESTGAFIEATAVTF